MEWYENASEEQIREFIVECIMEFSNATKEEAERFYDIAQQVDIDLWDAFDEELQEEFGNDEDSGEDTSDDWYPERDDDWCHGQGIM